MHEQNILVTRWRIFHGRIAAEIDTSLNRDTYANAHTHTHNVYECNNGQPANFRSTVINLQKYYTHIDG